MTVSPGEWNARAARAEYAVLERYVTRMPGLAWGRSAWPAQRRGDPRPRWHFWWSAHLVDAAIDAAAHRPSPGRGKRVHALARGIRARNGGTLRRPFWDDLAWLGLAFERAGRRSEAARVAARLEAAIAPTAGAIGWRIGSTLYNAPANGPAAILFARTGRRDAAARLADWMHDALHDPVSGLIFDGVDAGHVVEIFYTYCQGVALGAFVTVGRPVDVQRAVDLVASVAAWCGSSGVLPGCGAGDGGLFAGITCRYLALTATRLDVIAAPSADAVALRRAAASARSIVVRSAEAAWNGRATVDGRPLFSVDWVQPADPAPAAPERDLSVQLGAWLALEAAVDASS